LRGHAQRLIAAGRWEDARQPLEQLVAIYPEDGSRDGAYAQLAAVHRQLNEKDVERSTLEQLAGRSDDAVPAYLRLLELHAAANDWEGVRRNVDRLLAVNPLLAAPHRWLALAAERSNDDLQAVEALRALLRFEPLDLADVHYRLANRLLRLGDRAAARRHVLMALEEAPRFQAAHELLLELVTPAAVPETKPESDKGAAAESQRDD
jgi:tetratricopeptide (TPR) repeat protein